MSFRIIQITEYPTHSVEQNNTSNTSYQIQKKLFWFWIGAGYSHKGGRNDIFRTFEEAQKGLASFIPKKTTKVVVWPKEQYPS